MRPSVRSLAEFAIATTTMNAIDSRPDAVTMTAFGRPRLTSWDSLPGVVQSIAQNPANISSRPTTPYNRIAPIPRTRSEPNVSDSARVVVTGCSQRYVLVRNVRFVRLLLSRLDDDVRDERRT